MSEKTQHVLVIILMIVFAYEANSACAMRYSNYIRKHGSFDSEIIQKIPKFTPLIIEEETNNWLKVHGRNFKGWIHKKIVDTQSLCLLPNNTKNIECPGHKITRKSPLSKNEGLKIIKNEMACAKVLDKYGNSFYIFTGNVWPSDIAKKIEL